MTAGALEKITRNVFLGTLLAGVFSYAAYLLTAPVYAHAAGFAKDTNGTLTTNLVSYYALSDVADTNASNNLTNNGSSSFSSSGGPISGRGYVDGGSGNSSKYLNYSGDVSVGSGAYSISGWVYFDSTPSSLTQNTFYTFAIAGGSDGNFYALYFLNSSNGHLYLDAARNQVGSGTYTYDNTESLVSGTWYYVTLTYDGTTLKIYYNGTEKNSVTETSSPNSGAVQGIALLRDTPIVSNGNLYFPGKVAEFGFWNKALSSQEVTDLWNGGAGDAFTVESRPSFSSPGQYKSNGSTAINDGSSTTETTVVFKGTVSSASTTDNLQMQVEVEPTGMGFVNPSATTSSLVIGTSTVLATSSLVTGTSTVSATAYNLGNNSYHWQARTLDTTSNLASPWQSFSTSSIDFTVAVPSDSHFAVDTNYTLMTNLVSYYPLANTTDVYSAKTLANSGSVSFSGSGGPISGRGYGDGGSGNSSNYLNYSGNVNVTSGAYSMAGWMYFDDSPSSLTQNALIPIVVAGGSDGNFYGLYFLNSSNGHLYLDAARNETGSGTYTYDNTESLVSGTWYHLALTYDGTTLKIYYNGTQKNSVAETSSPDSGAVQGVSFLYDTPIVTNQNKYFPGRVAEFGFWDKALSSQEVTDLWNGGAGDAFSQGMGLSGLQQYKSDAATTINKGSSTTESTVVFGATLYSTSTNNLRLDVEVKPAGTAFTGIPTTSSTFVSSGSSTTVVFGTSTLVYPRDPESWSNGNFHWQARVEDTNGVTSTWQLFGANTSTTDFKINAVPLYMQKYGPWPSYASTTDWHNELYDGSSTVDCAQLPATSTIGYCGCSMTSVVMWLRYSGITTDSAGNAVNPKNLNTWLTNNGGYNASGDLKWLSIQDYASSTSGSIVYDTNSDNYGTSTNVLRPYIDANLSSSTPNPVILRENLNSHFVVATGFASNAGTSTYTTRDSAYYLTRYLNETSSTDLYGYNNRIDGVHIYYDPPSSSRAFEYDVNLPNALMLVDSQGRRTGKNPATGTRYHEIPGTSYGEEGHSGQLFVSGVSDGAYTLYVLGGEAGSYWVDAWPRQEMSGDVQAGTMVTYTLNYNSARPENPSLVFQSTVSSANNIISEPPRNLPPPALPVPTEEPSPPPIQVIYPVPPIIATSSKVSVGASSSTSMQGAASSTRAATSTSQQAGK